MHYGQAGRHAVSARRLDQWGDAYGTVFSTHLSDDGETFREMGHIETGDGGTDSFWWRSTTSGCFA